MVDRHLVPAEPQHVHAALSAVMRRSFTGYRGPTYEQVADLAAEHVAAALEREGFVIMRRAPAPHHSGHPPAHARDLGES